MNYSEDNTQHIAVIGMTGRFPYAKNVEEFWHNMVHRIECIDFFSDQEALLSGVDPELLRNPNYIKACGVLEDIDMFDASFFGLSPREAALMDPQQRLFLECSWEVLEYAGYDPERYKGRIGVYASTSSSSYLEGFYRANEHMNPLSEFQTMLGIKDDFLATRVSYKLNLRGPSMTVQTACSSSLVATHLACQSLLNFESDMALAGGVSINVPQKRGYLYQEGSIMSPDGHCRAFDARAQGIVDGSGVGIVLLKRLSDALTDGDTIHAIIKGSAINNDGSAKIGYTAPSIDGQAEVIAEALAVADFHPETVSYVEAHGTGTPLGDPIEIAALIQAFQAHTQKKSFCAIGSVKTNIGHLDVAAGVAGLIKVILALDHKVLPPSLHFEQPNPEIDFANSPFFVNTQAVPWNVTGYPRRAGVSSFGIGGTNVHVLLEEAPPVVQTQSTRTQQVLVVSAKTAAALEAATDNLVAYFRQFPNLALADIAYTLQVGRQTFRHRRALACAHIGEAVTLLANRDPQHLLTALCDAQNLPVVFMFPGGGTQYPNMGRELYQTEVTYREEINRCLKLLQSLGVDLRSFLYPDSSDLEKAGQQLQQSSLALSAIFITEYALAKLWMSWGINPQAMIGHSFGEYVAACLSGVMSLKDALSMIVFRAQLVEQLPKGAMLVVPLPVCELEPLLDEKLSLAAVNGPAFCVVSGPVDAIDTFEKSLQSRVLEIHRIHLEGAYHSSMVAPILEEFKMFIKQLPLYPPTIPYISNVTGTWITAGDATDPDYWAKHLRQTVRFAEGIQELLRGPSQVFLEIGGGHGMCSLARLHMNADQKRRVFPSLRHPQDLTPDSGFLLHTLSHLWLQGVSIDWHGFYAHERRQRVVLPTYPFERQRHWLKSQELTNNVNANRPARTKALNILDCLYASSWKQRLLPTSQRESRTETESYWLVFTITTVEDQIIRQTEQWGQRTISIIQGERFSKQQNGSYTINPQECSDWVALFDELLAENKKLPDKILYLWSVAPYGKEGAIQDLSNLFVLFQILREQQQDNPTEVIVVSNKALALTDEDLLRPEDEALLVGLCNSFSLLSSNTIYRMVDVILPQEKPWQEMRLIDRLLAEMSSEATDQVVAYRGDRRWIQAFESLTQLNTAAQRGISRLQQHGSYILIGGLENIGLLFARYIAQNVSATFILLEYGFFPVRDQWDQWLGAHDGKDRIGREINCIRSLEETCIDVYVFSTDAHTHRWQAELTRVIEQCSEIHGIFYQEELAEYEQGNLGELDLSELLRCLQLRMHNIVDLERALQTIPLDFCYLSSLSLVTTEAARIIEVVTNRQIEAFIQLHNSAHPVAWSSIQWDASCFEKEQVDSLSPKIIPTESIIAQQELNEIFQQLLAVEGVPQIIISTRSPYTWPGKTQESIFQPTNTKILPEQESRQNPLPSALYLSPRNEIEAAVVNIWKELLGIEQISMYDNFFMLGGHSLLATQLTSRLREAFLLEVPLQSVFVNPTIAELATAIEELFLETVENLSEEEAQQLMNNESSSEF